MKRVRIQCVPLEVTVINESGLYSAILGSKVEGAKAFKGVRPVDTLGYARPTKAVLDHCKGVPFWEPLETAGGTQQTRFITEGDVYRLIFNSKLPTAEKFEALGHKRSPPLHQQALRKETQ